MMMALPYKENERSAEPRKILLCARRVFDPRAMTLLPEEDEYYAAPKNPFAPLRESSVRE
jgi:hypothetical protein